MVAFSYLWLVVIFSGLFSPALLQEDTVEVEIPLGKLLGSVKTSVGGRTFYSFTGIPYAVPPLGSLRFLVRYIVQAEFGHLLLPNAMNTTCVFVHQPPVPVEPWQEVYDATQVPATCVQYFRTPSNASEPVIVGIEDCLVLNVYSPEVDMVISLFSLFFILSYFPSFH